MSHIVPRFVYSWLRDTSATGHMRTVGVPNLRVQDGPKEKLLCSDCEQRFGAWEKEFADVIFYPYHEDTSAQIRYAQFLLKFAVSLSWRVFTYFEENNRLGHFSAEQLEQAKSAVEVWRCFLTGSRDSPLDYVQHLLPLDLVESYGGGQGVPGINFYFLCTVDFDCVVGNRSAFVFTKMPGFACFGFLQKPERKDWGETKINLKTGVIQPSKLTIPAGVWNYFRKRASALVQVNEQMSEKQLKKASEAFNTTSRDVLSSRTLRAMYQDYKLSGGKVFVKKENGCGA